jgi:hypothetical protein
MKGRGMEDLHIMMKIYESNTSTSDFQIEGQRVGLSHIQKKKLKT